MTWYGLAENCAPSFWSLMFDYWINHLLILWRQATLPCWYECKLIIQRRKMSTRLIATLIAANSGKLRFLVQSQPRAYQPRQPDSFSHPLESIPILICAHISMNYQGNHHSIAYFSVCACMSLCTPCTHGSPWRSEVTKSLDWDPKQASLQEWVCLATEPSLRLTHYSLKPLFGHS